MKSVSLIHIAAHGDAERGEIALWNVEIATRQAPKVAIVMITKSA